MLQKGFQHSKATKEKIRHLRTGTHLSETTRQKLSESSKKAWTPERRLTFSKSRKGHLTPIETRIKISNSEKGKVVSEETREKMKVTNKGKGHSMTPDHLVKLSNINKMLRSGCVASEETITKLVEFHIGGFWYGNIRYYDDALLYCEKFNEDLRERVRAYWNYQCFECNEMQKTTKLHVHHIHYNKKTCCDGSPHDMIPLCHTCHAKTNHNRNYWEKHFTQLLYQWNPDGKCFFTKEEMLIMAPVSQNLYQPYQMILAKV